LRIKVLESGKIANFAEKIEMLEFKDATIAVGGRVLARRLSLIARDGELTCVTGPEGSGKTVLLRTLMGFLPVEEGFVSVDGELLTQRSSRAFRTQMVYLPQQMQLLRRQLEPVEAGRAVADEYGVWNMTAPRVTTLEPAAVLGPEEIFRLAEQTLKAGSGKRIVIADEPCAMLSPELTARLLELLRGEARAGKTVLVASRRQEVIDQADQVARLQ